MLRLFIYSILYLFIILSNKQCFGDNFLPSTYFCSEMNTQKHIDIAQLHGMWFVVEKIEHTDDLRYIRNLTTCPVIHISEDQTRTTTYNPLYKNYDAKYGNEYGYDGNNREEQRRTSPYDYDNHRNQPNQRESDGSYYYTTPIPYYHRQYNPRKYGGGSGTFMNHDEYIRHLHVTRYLRLLWDNNGDPTEYHLKYNISRPGFWQSSGPEDGTHLTLEYQHFAGTIQVLKAVGNHLILNFCHQLPTRQMFSVILSRETRLSAADRHSAHNLLAYRGLTTTAVQRMCSGYSTITVNMALVCAIVFVLILHKWSI